MVSGRVLIHGTLKDFLLVGLSSQQLWFARDRDPKEEKILSSWSDGGADGYRCTACGAVLIKGRPVVTQSDMTRKERTCDNCGSIIAGNPKTCGDCGADLK